MALLGHASTIRRSAILQGKKRFVWQLKIADHISSKKTCNCHYKGQYKGHKGNLKTYSYATYDITVTHNESTVGLVETN